MDFNREDFLLLYRDQTTLGRRLTDDTKKLEATVKNLGLDPEECATLNFPQLGERHYRPHTVEGILRDYGEQFYRYIFAMDFVARSLEQPPEISEVINSLHNIIDAINYVFQNHGIKRVDKPADPKDMEENMNEETRFWLACKFRSESKSHYIHPVRNYAIAKSLSDWLDAFGRDVRELAEDSRITRTESHTMHACYDESVYCVTFTEAESVVHSRL